MEGRIGRLDCRCQVLGAAESSGALQAHINRIVRERLTGEYDTALEEALGDDAAVYVLRRVRMRYAFVLDSAATDGQVAQRWGKQMAHATVGRIAREPDGDNLVRFENQADYVAHFVVDLLAGLAWSRWFYGAFGAVRSLDTVQALRAVLDENRAHLPAILSYLHRYGGTRALLAALRPEGCAWLWSVARGQEPLDRAGAISLLDATSRLIDPLGLWKGTRPQADQLVDEMLAARSFPVDWRDMAALTDTVLDMARWLVQSGHVARPTNVDSEVLGHLRDALSGLDWLDAERLEAGLRGLLKPLRPPASDLPLRPATHAPVPHLQRLLEDLQRVLTGDRLVLDESEPDSTANALRLYGALVAAEASWGSDALAAETIRRLLQAWKMVRAGSPSEFLFSLGEPGTAVIKSIERNLNMGRRVDGDAVTRATNAGTTAAIETPHAGIALLIRALIDARIYARLKTGIPGLPPDPNLVLLAILLSLAGARDGDPIDPGLALLAGWEAGDPSREDAGPLDRFQLAWDAASDPAEWQATCLEIVTGHRLLERDAMHVFRVEHAGDKVLIAGDGAGQLWLFASAFRSDEHARQLTGLWTDTWEEITGQRPVVVGDEARAESGADYAQNRERLTAMLGLVSGPITHNPAWDLTLALTANTLFRLWARWLRGFAQSSVPYLLDRFLRRPGSIYQVDRKFIVELEPRPLDVVLTLSDYLAPLRVPWLNDAEVEFKTRGA